MAYLRKDIVCHNRGSEQYLVENKLENGKKRTVISHHLGAHGKAKERAAYKPRRTTITITSVPTARVRHTCCLLMVCVGVGTFPGNVQLSVVQDRAICKGSSSGCGLPLSWGWARGLLYGDGG